MIDMPFLFKNDMEAIFKVMEISALYGRQLCHLGNYSLGIVALV